MYIKTWDEFQAAAEALYAKNPVKVRYQCSNRTIYNCRLTPRRIWQTRYCVKWRSVEGKLVLKVTDDSTVRRPRILSPSHSTLG